MKKMLFMLLFVLLFVSCGKALPAETIAAPVTTAEEPLPKTERSVAEVDPAIVETVDALPAPVEDAILSAHAVGGNPRFLLFEEGLTYYVVFYGDIYAQNFLSIEKCTLSLPKGCTDGKIVAGTSGAGSGEVLLQVTAKHGEENVYLDYLFYCDNIAVPVFVWEGEQTPIRPE